MSSAEATPEPRRRAGRIIGRVAFGVLAAVLLLATAAALFLVWTVQRSFPQTSGELAVTGLQQRVTVQRDERGIPTVTAGTAHDLFFAQGFVHAQDRFWEMDFRRHVTSGRVAELFGASQVGTDKFLRTLGWHAIAEKEVAAMDATTRGYYEAYADGVNAYLADHRGADASFEYAVVGMNNSGYEIERWTPADSVAWLKAMAWDLRGNVEDETARALLAPTVDAATMNEIYPAYPFSTHPVIVPTITPMAPGGSGDSVAADVPLPSSRPTSEPATDTPETGPSAPASPAAAPKPGAETAAVRWTTAPTVLDAVREMIGTQGEGIGSNSWVVSGSLTATGKPLLANDPHLGAALPSVWYQMHLRCRTVSADCPFDVAGFSFSGLPSIVIGHNADIAWGFTNLTTDVTDLNIEKVDGDAYWRDGVRVPLQTRTETIKVAGADDITLTVRSTAHGPIVSGLVDDFTALAKAPIVGRADAASPGGERGVAPDPAADALPGQYAVSLRWTALDPGTTASAIFAMNTAKDFTDFRYAASLFDVPAQNLIYADQKGNIGYQTPGRLPIRGAGNGYLPQPGWSSEYDWTGYIPFDELPVSYNPDQGYIVTANNAIVPDSYPYFLSRDWDYGYRAARIVELIESTAKKHPLTAQDMRDIQFDQQSWIGKQLAAAVVDLPALKQGTGARGAGIVSAVSLLRTWDAQATADSPAAAYANVLWQNLALNIFANREHPLPLDDQGRLFTVVGAMLENPDDPLWTNPKIGVASREEMLALSAGQAYDELAKAQGADPTRWHWGELHAITLTHQTLGKSGIAPIEWLFNRGPFPIGGGSSLVDATGWPLGGSYAATTVPSMRMVVDLSDFDASTWNHLTGASGHAFGPHYTDQTENWSKGLQSPWPFSAKAVDRAAVDTLVLAPKG
ncbi:MAG: penicillin acylase family protein [Actinobacteria bacterium]|nr:penicillin acylase family protein [Actinomycetota bacterium]